MKINLISYYDMEDKKVKYDLIREDNETKYVDKKVIRTFENKIEDFVNYILEKDGKVSLIGNKLYLFLNSKDIDEATKEKLDMLAIRKYMLTNKEMKLFVILNNAEIYVNEEKAYLTSKTKLSDDIVSKENIEIIRKAIQNVTGKDYIVEYVEKK